MYSRTHSRGARGRHNASLRDGATRRTRSSRRVTLPVCAEFGVATAARGRVHAWEKSALARGRCYEGFKGGQRTLLKGRFCYKIAVGVAARAHWAPLKRTKMQKTPNSFRLPWRRTVEGPILCSSGPRFAWNSTWQQHRLFHVTVVLFADTRVDDRVRLLTA